MRAAPQLLVAFPGDPAIAVGRILGAESEANQPGAALPERAFEGMVFQGGLPCEVSRRGALYWTQLDGRELTVRGDPALRAAFEADDAEDDTEKGEYFDCRDGLRKQHDTQQRGSRRSDPRPYGISRADRDGFECLSQEPETGRHGDQGANRRPES